MSAPIYHYRRGPKTAHAPRQSPEHALQVSVAQFLDWFLPDDIVWTASLSGAHLGPAQRTKAKAAGLRRGCPDIVLVIPGRGAVWIELKADKGVLSDDQKRWRDAIQPGRWALCRSLEEVAEALQRWGVVMKPGAHLQGRYSGLS